MPAILNSTLTLVSKCVVQGILASPLLTLKSHVAMVPGSAGHSKLIVILFVIVSCLDSVWEPEIVRAALRGGMTNPNMPAPKRSIA